MDYCDLAVGHIFFISFFYFFLHIKKIDLFNLLESFILYFVKTKAVENVADIHLS